jgi:hypothetical protein
LVYEKHHIYREKKLNREGKPPYLEDLQHKEGDPEKGRERVGNLDIGGWSCSLDVQRIGSNNSATRRMLLYDPPHKSSTSPRAPPWVSHGTKLEEAELKGTKIAAVWKMRLGERKGDGNLERGSTLGHGGWGWRCYLGGGEGWPAREVEAPAAAPEERVRRKSKGGGGVR